MIAIDHGLCVAGYYILAECSRRANNIEGERKYLTLARDATSWDLSKTIVPRPYSVMQDVVREETSRHNVQLIDLPALFKEHLRGGLPDRRLFLDYCHVTTEGMQVSMAAAAACVLRAVKGRERAWQALVDDRVAPAPDSEAEALLLAAIINAHCGSPMNWSTTSVRARLIPRATSVAGCSITSAANADFSSDAHERNRRKDVARRFAPNP